LANYQINDRPPFGGLVVFKPTGCLSSRRWPLSRQPNAPPALTSECDRPRSWLCRCSHRETDRARSR
jgi:hypothetical protein